MALEEIAPYLGFAVGGLMAVLILVVVLGIYVYQSFAYMAIAKKNKQSSPGIAWIPGVGPNIVAMRAAKMHWWPWLLLIGFVIPVVNFVAIIIFAVYTIIWNWKMFVSVKRPGWWVLFNLIPYVGAIVFLILLGIAAWSK